MPDANLLLYVVLAAIIALGFFIWRVHKSFLRFEERQQTDQSMQMLNQNMVGVQQRLDQSTESLNYRLDNAARIIVNVQRELSTVQEIGRGIKEFQEMLTSPKLRGNIGEHILNDSLAQVFPQSQYVIQHQFRDGQTVDAVIKTEKGLLPVDSKFPMENFRKMLSAEDAATRAGERKEAMRAVRKHIDDIARKYILPAEGTLDFAIMYVPAESIYYEIMMNDDEALVFAREKKVLVVSPNAFFHFLRVILMGLERHKLHEESQRIWELLKGIQQEAGKFHETLTLTSKHLTNAKNAMDGATSEYLKLTGRIDQVKLLK